MLMLTRRAAALLLVGFQPATAFVPHPSSQRSLISTTPSSTFLAAAPGVVTASKADILAALDNPKTVVVDARGVDEIKENGLFQPSKARWVHAQCTLEECPLLSTASEALIPDKSAPVLVYCASGKRATKAKEVLDALGYVNVLNGGSLDDLTFAKN
jgi:phage shock protein E